ncbi:hypothetical protein LZ31DRAFT_27405 [Colletotrichum somersetense]|nr:hypothetical protein LZ31DRAFT_27405 [Colletotrichum somersetense]
MLVLLVMQLFLECRRHGLHPKPSGPEPASRLFMNFSTQRSLTELRDSRLSRRLHICTLDTNCDPSVAVGAMHRLQLGHWFRRKLLSTPPCSEATRVDEFDQDLRGIMRLGNNVVADICFG